MANHFWPKLVAFFFLHLMMYSPI